MLKNIYYILIPFLFLCTKNGSAQINEDQLGAWYMYFYDTTLKKVLGVYKEMFNTEIGILLEIWNNYY